MEDNKSVTNEFEEMDINSDSDVPGNTHLSNPENDLFEETEKLAAELKEQKDKYIRLSAEFENFKRRTAKEKVEMVQTAGKDIITSLLDVLDDCDRAEMQMQQTDDIALIKEGNLLVFNKLKNILQQKGLKAMQSKGQEFDVELHEALAEVTSGGDMKGKVVDEAVKGYYLNEKLIRFAKVIVGK